MGATHPRLLAAATEIAPYQQGDLDGLCGLYAVINAIRLGLYPNQRLPLAECRALLRKGVAGLGRPQSLPLALETGIEWARLRQAARRLVAGVPNDVGLRVCPLPPRQIRRDRWAWIEDQIEAGNPVIVHDASGDHYTVAITLGANRLRIFDSSGSHWLRRRDIDVIRAMSIVSIGRS